MVRIPTPLRPLVGAAILVIGVRLLDAVTAAGERRRSDRAPEARPGAAVGPGRGTTLVRALALGAVLRLAERMGLERAPRRRAGRR
jgi:hypothetical protein